MPFQPINFANIEPQGAPFFRNLVQTLMQGYKAGQMPAQMQRQNEQENLENAFRRMRNEEEPEKYKSEQEFRAAQTGKMRDEAAKQAWIKSLISGGGQQQPQGQPQGQRNEPSIMSLFGGPQQSSVMPPMRQDQGQSPQQGGFQFSPKDIQQIIRMQAGLPAESAEEIEGRKTESDIAADKRKNDYTTRLEYLRQAFEARKNEWKNKSDQAADERKYKNDVKLLAEKFKLANEKSANNANAITPATRTKFEQRVASIDLLDDALNDLQQFSKPSNWTGLGGDTDLQEKYNALVTSGIEKMMSGENWLGIAENVKKAENMLRIGTRESPEGYKTKIQAIRDRIKKEKGIFNNKLNSPTLQLNEPVKDGDTF